MKPIRVGLICDLREEGWHSMDLIADMLLQTIPQVSGGHIAITSLRPPMTRRWTRLPLVGQNARAHLADRLTGRLWDYPRWLASRVDDFDLFHIVDHSYAHLVPMLPRDRTIVTCNDTDAIRAALPGGVRFGPSRLLASRILEGLGGAAHITCISRATRADLLASQRVASDRVSVSYLGAHPSCSPVAHERWDAEIDQQLGPRGADILHVGSTIPRKRIDVVLEMLAGLRESAASVRLIRVGGPLTLTQRSLAERLGVADLIFELPFLERPALAAVYRRSAIVVLPSDREGFGLPVIEAMACGTAVVASDIDALREIGGSAATYCAPGDVRSWVDTVAGLLHERTADPSRWQARHFACLEAAARFDWNTYAADMAKLYLRIAAPVAIRTNTTQPDEALATPQAS
jgi:glycosyltransferase involved in cell wall biosynthesis